MEQVFVSWSGGKDCSLAAYMATSQGLQVRYLANTVNEDGQQSRSHGLSAGVLKMQARAMGIPLVQRPTGKDNYEAEFKSMIRNFKKEGITGGVFGDIDFNEHRVWIDRVCQDVAITPHFPFWEQNQTEIMSDFINFGFKAIVVATRADILGEEWLGRKVDLDFVKYLAELGKTKPITPCGEAGEYHTLVIDGPLFKQRLEILETNRALIDGHWFLNILKSELSDK